MTALVLPKPAEPVLPTDRWFPRGYQRAAWSALEGGCKRLVWVWHRRAGKDTMGLRWVAQAMLDRVGVYWHVLPTLRQGRRIIWNGRTKEGVPFLSAFPSELVVKQREDEMYIGYANGSIYQVVGSDNIDALVGANPIGVIMSEYPLQDPAAWDLIRPILAENEGWAIFPYTPRGHNHGWRLFKMARTNPKWFCQLLRAGDTEALPPGAIQDEIDAGMTEALAAQEFDCSFDVPVEGAYYGREMMAADKEGRICEVPHEPDLPVDTWWDLGVGDANAIWFVQRLGPQYRVINYIEESGYGLPWYIKEMRRLGDDDGYIYGEHIAPHDINVRELGSGERAISRKETARRLGVTFRVAPKAANESQIQDQRDKVRAKLPLCWFDVHKCARGIDALRNYRKEEDESKSDGVVTYYKEHHRHDWASHGADAFRTGIAGGGRSGTTEKPKPPRLDIV